jgi:hypothetical protein
VARFFLQYRTTIEELNELAAELIASTIATEKSAAQGVQFDDLEVISGAWLQLGSMPYRPPG